VGALLVACGGPAPTTGGSKLIPISDYKAEKGTKGGQLIFSDWQPIEDLYGLGSSAAVTQSAAGVIWASLWEFDPKNGLVPDLVTDVPTTENGMVKAVDSTHMDMTVKLKSGLKWSDGSALTTEDVKFTIDAICDPDTGASSQDGYDHISSIDVKSATEMVWHFGPATTPGADGKTYRCGLSDKLDNGTYAPYTQLGFQPYPKAVLANVKHADWATDKYFTQKPTVTSGHYMVQNFTAGPAAQVVMIPNPHYADGRSGAAYFNHAPYLDKLIYKIYGDKAAQIAGLKAGDTDMGKNLIAKDMDALKTVTQDTTQAVSSLLDEFLNLNLGKNTTGCEADKFDQTKCGKPTLFNGDKPLRQALALAVDKDAINTQLVAGIGTPMNGPFLHTFAPWYDTSIPKFKRDVAKANSLLDSDGWVKGSDGLRSKAGVKLAFTIATTSGNPQRAAEMEQIINNWKELGATVTPKTFPSGKFFAGYKSSGINATGQFDVSLYANSWSPDPNSWATTVITSQIPSATNSSGSNWNRVSDPKMDDLFSKGATELDIAKRIKIYKDAQTEWRDFVPTIELYERPDVFTWAKYFGNFAPNGNSSLEIWNSPDWYRKSA
jgi:peptide/nickel transport system substrate-binding protein